jgi:hypothetical protein
MGLAILTSMFERLVHPLAGVTTLGEGVSRLLPVVSVGVLVVGLVVLSTPIAEPV